jgi:hypothetical protein
VLTRETLSRTGAKVLPEPNPLAPPGAVRTPSSSARGAGEAARTESGASAADLAVELTTRSVLESDPA